MTRLFFAAVALTAALASSPGTQTSDSLRIRAPWAQGDPADSIYRPARAALNKGDYRKAADLFKRIRVSYPKSVYAGDACYWEAFSLYRIGATADLRSARAVLDAQRSTYANAATRGDAEALLARIQGELAKRGDSRAAAEVTASANAVAAAPAAAPVPPARPGMPAPAAVAGPPARPARAPVAMGVGPSGGIAGVGPGDDCPDEDDDARVAALNALISMDADRAQPVLEKVMARRDAGSACLRRKAVFLISQQRTDKTEDLLLNAARNDPDPEVKEQAVFWLSQVQSPKAAAALDSILRAPGSDDVREKALFALSQQNTPASRASIRSFAGGNDVPPHLQEQAIFWLGQSSNPEDATFLRSLYPKLRDQELKEKVFFAVAQSRSPENQKWLLQVAGDQSQDIELRKQALFWAGQSGVGVGEMAALYDKSTDSEMKEQIIFVLSQSKETAAVDKMLQIARTEKDRDLRKRAIFWLSQSDDPRAAKVLEEIIQQ
ncbi:MAG TPA: HEAT repeat domain-containing protein [Gemmatimonadales bacterium]|nr:HEAT repeat domain-containing protein [Gemmatimonadales bacterium]